ncbi:MarR family winged helix-turn-helix transcriptional regulator [Aestuariivita boseongensis]|uniref:MarR family winged helix-turn-helix transcriptional regulator n=1 Tax=Aestuariivita boseongensis TaxID=1470562 RepID=UPI00068290FF|nr:MarR family transcriptional regulator [Aestuariivita boseongensis]
MSNSSAVSATKDDLQVSASFQEIGLENYAPYLMNRIMGRYNANLRSEMSALGLSTAKMRALAILSVRDGLQIGDLGVFAVVEQSTLSRALDALVNDGLVRREADPKDQRASRVFLTDQGQAAFDRLWPHMIGGHDAMFKGIPKAEQKAFIATLRKMLSNIRKHEI